jgi:hypothetical protein
VSWTSPDRSSSQGLIPAIALLIREGHNDVATALAELITTTGSATDVAMRAVYGRAAPVLSNFNYDAATGNLLSYQEDGILIVLTYNADGTVATSQRGSDPVQTYTYSGGNLVGVA